MIATRFTARDQRSSWSSVPRTIIVTFLTHVIQRQHTEESATSARVASRSHQLILAGPVAPARRTGRPIKVSSFRERFSSSPARICVQEPSVRCELFLLLFFSLSSSHPLPPPLPVFPSRPPPFPTHPPRRRGRSRTSGWALLTVTPGSPATAIRPLEPRSCRDRAAISVGECAGKRG